MDLIVFDDILELSVRIDIQTILNCAIQLGGTVLTWADFEWVLVLFPDLRFPALVHNLDGLLDSLLQY